MPRRPRPSRIDDRATAPRVSATPAETPTQDDQTSPSPQLARSARAPSDDPGCRRASCPRSVPGAAPRGAVAGSAPPCCSAGVRGGAVAAPARRHAGRRPDDAGARTGDRAARAGAVPAAPAAAGARGARRVHRLHLRSCAARWAPPPSAGGTCASAARASRSAGAAQSSSRAEVGGAAGDRRRPCRPAGRSRSRWSATPAASRPAPSGPRASPRPRRPRCSPAPRSTGSTCAAPATPTRSTASRPTTREALVDADPLAADPVVPRPAARGRRHRRAHLHPGARDRADRLPQGVDAEDLEEVRITLGVPGLHVVGGRRRRRRARHRGPAPSRRRWGARCSTASPTRRRRSPSAPASAPPPPARRSPPSPPTAPPARTARSGPTRRRVVSRHPHDLRAAPARRSRRPARHRRHGHAGPRHRASRSRRGGPRSRRRSRRRAQGDPAGILALLAPLEADGGGFDAGVLLTCNDTVERPTPDQVATDAERARAADPLFGAYFAHEALLCGSWPVPTAAPEPGPSSSGPAVAGRRHARRPGDPARRARSGSRAAGLGRRSSPGSAPGTAPTPARPASRDAVGRLPARRRPAAGQVPAVTRRPPET